MSNVRFLTKSRFKVGYDCPTKLYFLDNKEFGNKNIDNSFLEALAEGGFQVGELAKQYFPGGVEISTLDKDEALSLTQNLLAQDTAIIFEAAIKHEDLFIRADILLKNGNRIDIIEVKAKSFDPNEEDQFYNKTSLKKGQKKLSSSWEPYLMDVAFQCYVVKSALPQMKVSGSLMLADKSKTATVDGLNQKFFLVKTNDGRASAQAEANLKREDLGEQILIQVPVHEEIALIHSSEFQCGDAYLPFDKMVNFLASTCSKRTFVHPVVGAHCKSCEFRTGEEHKGSGLKSGFEQCWSEAKRLTPNDFGKDFVFDIWNFRKAASVLASGKIFAEELEENEILKDGSSEDSGGLSSSARQWVQVEKIKTRDSTPYIDESGLSREMKTWQYPLNFIDFETTMAALPFHKGRRPYEQIAFQFSHHTVQRDGQIEHANQYINSARGAFPNFIFVRELKRALGQNTGTVFRYAAHENTVLCQIRKQLMASSENIPDREDLISFIESITTSEGNPEDRWAGQRSMVDMCELVKRYFYHPYTKGSNSIKKVLPAILNESIYLQEKYGKPVYGSPLGINSLNFTNWTWIQQSSEHGVIDPYKLLPPVFSDLSMEEMESLITDNSLADGGAAMTAYARMQFTQMGQKEVDFIVAALLKYCELDTFAMVLIFEYWKHAIEKAGKKAA